MNSYNLGKKIDEVLAQKSIVLDIGCGDSKVKDAIGIDIEAFECVDLRGDVFDVLARFPDGAVNKIYSSHFCEHLQNFPEFLKEIDRILEVGGTAIITVPHFSNPFFYSDPTHKQPFGLYTLSYFCDGAMFKRTLPNYCKIPSLRLIDIQLGFKSFPPRYVTHAGRKILGLLFNATNHFKEIYEDSFSNIISCYEICYTVRKVSVVT